MYKGLVLNVIIAVVFLIYSLLIAGNGYVDTTPNTQLEGLYNLFIKGNVLLLVSIIYLGLSIVLIMYHNRRKPS